MTRETKYDILDEYGERIYENTAYDWQCNIYYDPESMDMISGHAIKKCFMTVIETGYFEKGY
jgi:hypothetical protein